MFTGSVHLRCCHWQGFTNQLIFEQLKGVRSWKAVHDRVPTFRVDENDFAMIRRVHPEEKRKEEK